MKLAHFDHSFLLSMEENQVNVVVLESPGAFYRYVRALSDQLEGGRERFVLSHDGETLNMQEKCALLTDLFSLELNHKKASAALGKWLRAEALGERMLLETQQLRQAVTAWVMALSEESPYPLQYLPEPDVAQLIKSMDVQFSEESGSLLERLTSWLQVAQDFLKKECVFLVNAKRFLEREALRELYRFAFYRKLHLVLLENVERRDFPEEKFYVVDEDACEIYEDPV